MNLLRKLAVVIVAMAGASVVQAVPIIVNSEADFLSLVGDVTREGFESFPTDDDCTNPDGVPSINTSLLTVNTTPTAGGTSWLCVGTTAAGLPGPTEGNNALIAGSATGDSFILTFLLTEAVNAVYFELTDAVERGDAFISIDGLDDILVASRGSGGLDTVFFGIIFDQAFTEFSLINTGFADGWGIDNMIFATVPEPGTLGLFGIGLFALLFRRRQVLLNVHSMSSRNTLAYLLISTSSAPL